jgi:nucleotide-binding universal stress UspA family protein
MFRKVMVAFDDSPQANRALEVGIEIAKLFKTGLHLVTVSEPLPLYTAIIDVRVPGGRQMLLDDRDTYYRELQKGAIAQVTAAGLDVQALVIEGEEIQTLVDRIAEYNPDLLVLGRRHHSIVSGLWSGTLHNIAEKVSCNILAVY